MNPNITIDIGDVDRIAAPRRKLRRLENTLRDASESVVEALVFVGRDEASIQIDAPDATHRELARLEAFVTGYVTAIGAYVSRVQFHRER